MICEAGLGRDEREGGEFSSRLPCRVGMITEARFCRAAEASVEVLGRVGVIDARGVDENWSRVVASLGGPARLLGFLLAVSSLGFALVVRDGIIGPPARSVCGNLVEFDLFKPKSSASERVAGAAPLSAANDCALAAAMSTAFSLDSLRA